MKKGLILINAYTRILHALEQAQRLKDELNALGVGGGGGPAAGLA